MSTQNRITLASSAMLVDHHISVWTASRLDRSVTDELLVSKNAGAGAAQVKKNLMAGTTQRKDIADFAAGCRLWHTQWTMPWADKGVRLLPATKFLDYKQELNLRRDTFNQMVAAFLQDYDNLVLVAQNFLGDMFNASDYPSKDEVAGDFGYKVIFSPVPQAGDFRLDIPTRDMEALREGYEHAFQDRLQEAMKEPWERLYKMVSSMAEKLDDTGDRKKRFHDSFISNAEELYDLLGHMNLTQDPELEKARAQLKDTLQDRHIDSVRNDDITRRDMKEELDALLDQYRW